MSNWRFLLGFCAFVLASWLFLDSLFALLDASSVIYSYGFSYFLAGYVTVKLFMLGLSFVVIKYFYGVYQDE